MKAMIKKFRNYLSDEAGATAVEFGMVSLLFLLFLFGTIEFGRVFWTWNTLQYAVEETARYALVHPTATNDDLVAYAASSMAGISVDTALLSIVTTTPTIAGIRFIEVNGTYLFTLGIILLPAESAALTLKAESRIPYAQ